MSRNVGYYSHYVSRTAMLDYFVLVLDYMRRNVPFRRVKHIFSHLFYMLTGVTVRREYTAEGYQAFCHGFPQFYSELQFAVSLESMCSFCDKFYSFLDRCFPLIVDDNEDISYGW